ncbi:MAG: DNA repair protein RadC [Bacteroidales bacterium]|nr:DNA repair protein RadC [Bacteroidales bacterium]
MKIKDLYKSERPRERMLEFGPRALSTSELLAVLLRSGTPRMDVLQLSGELLKKADGKLVRLFGMTYDELRSLKGIGLEKACTVMAAFELGRRFLAEESGLDRTPVTGPRRVYELMVPLMKGLEFEELWVLLLSKANYVLGKRKLSSGGLESTTFDPRVVLKEAVRCGASSIVLVHNHPGGNPRPSRADIAQTMAMRKACSSLGITLFDHVIISSDSFYSFADERIYPASRPSSEPPAADGAAPSEFLHPGAQS